MAAVATAAPLRRSKRTHRPVRRLQVSPTDAENYDVVELDTNELLLQLLQYDSDASSIAGGGGSSCNDSEPDIVSEDEDYKEEEDEAEEEGEQEVSEPESSSDEDINEEEEIWCSDDEEVITGVVVKPYEEPSVEEDTHAHLAIDAGEIKDGQVDPLWPVAEYDPVQEAIVQIRGQQQQRVASPPRAFGVSGGASMASLLSGGTQLFDVPARGCEDESDPGSGSSSGSEDESDPGSGSSSGSESDEEMGQAPPAVQQTPPDEEGEVDGQ